MSQMQIFDKLIDTNFYNGIVIAGPTASGKSQLAQYIMEQFNLHLNIIDQKNIQQNNSNITHTYMKPLNSTISLHETASNLHVSTSEIPISLAESVIDINISIDAKRAVIINADSVQVYNVLHNLTAQPENYTDHHMYSFKNITESYSAHQWLMDLKKLLNDNKHFFPIIVGGTGFYIRALLDGIQDLPSRSMDTEWDDMSAQECLNLVKTIDPDSNINDKRRMIRFLDLHSQGINARQMQLKRIVTGNFYKIYVSPPSTIMKKRIKARLDKHIDEYVMEVKNLAQQSDKMHQIIGYTEISSYLQFLSTKQEIIDQIYTRTCQYAKRQQTWFKKYYHFDQLIENVLDVL